MWRSRLPVLVKARELEKRENITQKEIADATGLRTATISAWMNWAMMKRLDAPVVDALAKYLNCAASELYEWIPDEAEASEDSPEGQVEAEAVS